MNQSIKKLLNPFKNIVNKIIIFLLRQQRLTSIRDHLKVETYRNEILENCKMIIDVGSCSGNYIKNINKLSNKEIIAVEPDKIIFLQLKKSLSDNENFKFYNLALSNLNGHRNMNCYAIPELNSFLKISANQDFNPKFIEEKSVECRKLDDFLKDMKLSYIDFLNIDTNGHEIEIIDGAKEIFSSKKIKNIEISILSPCIYGNENENNLVKLLNILDKYGYHLKRIFFKPIDFKINKFYLFFC